MLLENRPPCFSCKHYDYEKMTCGAYPDGIPEDIRTGEVVHNKVLEGQKGNFVFEPKTNEDENI
jgi:hypothetical protein